MNVTLKAGLMAAAAALVLASAVPTTEAQIIPASAQKAERGGPSLTAFRQGVNDEKDRRELGISVLDIDVNVRGGIAETIVTATFTNPGTDILEGRFVLDMAKGAVVTGYALDVNGVMIDGVLETRYKAAEAYQSRVNRRIDPGLAEVSYSDRFETRIYPIPGKGQRTIRLKMVSQFDPADGYILPLTIGKPVGSLTLDVTGEARVTRAPSGLKTQMSNAAKEITLNGELRLAAEARPAVMVSRHPGAGSFFDIQGTLPRGAMTRNKPVHILWDRSVSRIDDELKEEAQLAEDLVKKRGLRRAMITFFDSGKVETREVMADRISEALNDARYRGGTSYATLDGLAMVAGADCLMFSDGRVSIDDRRDFLPDCSVTAVTSGPERDLAWLGDIAQRTGGAVHVLTKRNATDVFKLLDRPDAGIVAVTDGAGKAIEFATLAADRRAFQIVGPVPDDGVVQVRVEGEAQARRFDVASVSDARFSGPGALWARHRLGVIEADTKPDDLAAMARRYNVATPQASFIVLEAPGDYVDSDIAPPATYPKELMTVYASLRDNADRAERDKKERRLTEVVGLWEQQKAWWEKKFDGVDTRPKQDAMRPSAPGAPPVTAAPMPMPAPPPSPAMRAPPAEAEARDMVVVTGSLRSEAPQDAAMAVSAFSREEAGDDGDTAAPSRGGSISVAEWKADRPYLKALDAAGNDWERAIDREMKTHGAIPLFWFDVAEWHWRKGRKEEARRAVEAALDLPTRDNQTLAIVAGKLQRYGSLDRAVWLLTRLMEREEQRPQPKRSLALALLKRADQQVRPEFKREDIQEAIALLTRAATDVYEQPARGMEGVALMEANAALAKLKRIGGSSDALDPRLVALLDADLRVVVEWNTPRTDLDLWVEEPKGYDVGYSSPLSPWGGKLSGDITNGYGPEEYAIRRAVAGTYEIRANTFASDPANPNGPSSLTVRLIRNFGRADQSEELMDIEMPAAERERAELGKITIE